ncbi:hypothetical protein SteCoe_6218 [Stentor coeruleus]|uniref:MYND-type domain-containing protein n=1 Tax=Stentor coeruleus TaxID=5963 RepID=A0A1R2CQG2_9CILI|nr:hypothetical protein SteCoe_6218 [Stentor coeruleus]
MQEESKFLCAICKKPTLMCCSACKNVFYCSEAHQIQHWESHMHECAYSEPPSTDSSHLTPNETFDIRPEIDSAPENSLIADEEIYKTKYKSRREITVLIASGKSAQAANKGRVHFNKVLTEYERNRFFDIYDLLADGVILAKAYLTSGELNQARQILLTLVQKMMSHAGSHEAGHSGSFRPDESKGEKGTLAYEELKAKCSAYSTLGTLFSTCGDNLNGEKMYVQYCKLIILHLGPASLEASNCYFMMGLFYQEQKLLEKSIAAFKKSEDIRIEVFGENHESISDCEYNLGLLFKRKENWYKANVCLQKALNIRIRHSSEGSLPVAQVYEALGSLYMHTKDFKVAYEKLTACYNIRKNLLKHCPNHEDLSRITTLLSSLSNKIEEETKKDQQRRAELSMFNPMFSPENSPQQLHFLHLQNDEEVKNPASSIRTSAKFQDKTEDSFQWLGETPEKK